MSETAAEAVEQARAAVAVATTDWARARASKALVRAVKLRDHMRYVERTYPITEAQWRAIFRAQGGACAICKRPFKSVLPAVDHNHLTGEVRGLLCGGSFDAKTCNRIIGFWKDDPRIFRRAADYLADPPARKVLA